MSRPCSVCGHPERPEIDAALIAGTAYRDVAGRFGLARTSLARHAAHHLGPLRAATNRARERNLFSETEHLIAAVEGVLQRARKQDDDRLLLLGVREARENLALLAKLRGSIDAPPTVTVLLADPQWLTIFGTVRRALVAHPGALAAVDAAVAELEAAGEADETGATP